MSHEVFISYSSEDKNVANAVVAKLEERGIRCWIAPRDVPPGGDWSESLLEAIEGCKVLVLVFSKHSNKSEHIKREVERAVHHGIPILPFRIEDVLPSKALEYFISTAHWMDAISPPVENHIQNLSEAIRHLMSGDIQKAARAVASSAASAERARAKARPAISKIESAPDGRNYWLASCEIFDQGF